MPLRRMDRKDTIILYLRDHRGQLAELACAALKVIFNEWFIWVKGLLQHQDTFLTFDNELSHITRTRRLSKKDFMV